MPLRRVGPVSAALCLLLLGPLAAAASLPPIPKWVRGPTYKGPGYWKDFTIKQQRECQAVVKAADKAGERFDFVLYGDSVLRVIARGSKAEWKQLFPPSKGWHAVPLGVSGNDIEDVAWRLMTGAEKPKAAPKVVGLLVGTNNLRAHQSASMIAGLMDYLLGWMQAAFPDSEILVLNLLPRTSPDVGPVNKKLKALCEKRGIHWSTCGSDIDPRDPRQLYDGTHPAQEGADKVLRCLAPEVGRLAGKA
ncbi:hypothetical protein ABPG75_000675 [Micractinium tetrahymenae]